MNVLIISLAYAPYSGVGAARMTSLSKYLIDKNENVTVLCYESRTFGESEQKREIPEGIERIVVGKLKNKRQNIQHLKREVEQIIKKKSFNLCIVSVGPFEPMFFIEKLWKKWRIPYIVDYRDPWLFEKGTIKLKGILKYKVMVHDFLCVFFEKRVIKNARKIVLVTDRCKMDLAERYHIPNDKCSVIYNGYEDVPEKVNFIKKNEFIIGVAGKFAAYNEQAAMDFLQVCRKIDRKIKVVHIGNEERILSERFPAVYQNIGVKNHSDTMLELSKVDVTLINYAFISGLGTKVFDYIALNKPIIYIGNVPSELSSFVDKFKNGYVCKDSECMQKALKDLCMHQDLNLTDDDIYQYSREKQNEMYYSLIKNIFRKGEL